MDMDPQLAQAQASNANRMLSTAMAGVTATSAPTATTTSGRKRSRKSHNDDEGGTSSSGAEPRRLRRSHEACARCRNKKIKCDSKYPKCTACATAGALCQQEDRIRQTLQPRGYSEHLKRQLVLCEAVIKHFIPDFDQERVEETCASLGIDLTPFLHEQQQLFPPPPPPSGYGQQPPPHQLVPPPPPGAYLHHLPYPPPPHPHHPQNYPPLHHPHLQPGHPAHPYPLPPQMYQHPHAIPLHPPPPPPPSHSLQEVPGQDPQLNDMSNTKSLAKNFEVSADLVQHLHLNQAYAAEREDLAVGSSALTSGRDLELQTTTVPRDKHKWISVNLQKSAAPTLAGLIDPPPAVGPTSTSTLGIRSDAPVVPVWLPKDRQVLSHIVDVYFTRLSIHRPVFFKADFLSTLDDLYSEKNVPYDPGFLCSLYLVLALGTLSELNFRAVKKSEEGDSVIDDDGETSNNHNNAQLALISAKKLMPPDWPEHAQFFEMALSVKSDLRVMLSSVQALILLHWYLYTERQGRTLWRLVGSLVRLSVELGLHHDPTRQPETFNQDQCTLRIRLWSIVMIHDRGTSILLGRPLAISPSDSNTPHPTPTFLNARSSSTSTAPTAVECSETFDLSHAVADIQADIINSLYSPKHQTVEEIMSHASRIIQSMSDFRSTLPESYKFLFGVGTEDWPIERRSKLVESITEDQGMTLLKLGISRILLLRALFNRKDLNYFQRRKALVDAIIASHNIIVIHRQLIRFPDIAFFTSPIPLHIAAMVILYGHMSRCNRLSREVALEDMWLALDMLPRFRWRWERKDANGGHPLIAKLVERVMDVDLHTIRPPAHCILLAEEDWELQPQEDTNAIMAPLSPSSTIKSDSTPTMPPISAYPPITPSSHSAHPRGLGGGGAGQTSSSSSSNSGGSSSTNGHSKQPQLLDVPSGLFYPFYPEEQPQFVSKSETSSTTSPGPSGAPAANRHPDYSRLLAAASPHLRGYALQSQDAFMSEERDDPRYVHTTSAVVLPTTTAPGPGVPDGSGLQMWVNTGVARGPGYGGSA